MISVHVDYWRRGREKFDNYVWRKVWEKIFARVMVLKGRGFERNCSMCVAKDGKKRKKNISEDEPVTCDV